MAFISSSAGAPKHAALEGAHRLLAPLWWSQRHAQNPRVSCTALHEQHPLPGPLVMSFTKNEEADNTLVAAARSKFIGTGARSAVTGAESGAVARSGE